MTRAKSALATLALAAAGYACFMAGRMTVPDTALIATGLHSLTGENAKLLADIDRYQAGTKALEASLQASREREARHKREADRMLSVLADAQAKAKALEAREPEVRADVQEAETLLASTTPEALPEPCQPFYAEVAKLTADVQWGLELLHAERSKYGALDKAFKARDMELDDAHKQVALYQTRLADADKLIRRAKKSSRKVKLAGAAVLAVGVFLAVR